MNESKLAAFYRRFDVGWMIWMFDRRKKWLFRVRLVSEWFLNRCSIISEWHFSEDCENDSQKMIVRNCLSEREKETWFSSSLFLFLLLFLFLFLVLVHSNWKFLGSFFLEQEYVKKEPKSGGIMGIWTMNSTYYYATLNWNVTTEIATFCSLSW